MVNSQRITFNFDINIDQNYTSESNPISHKSLYLKAFDLLFPESHGPTPTTEFGIIPAGSMCTAGIGFVTNCVSWLKMLGW